MSATRHNAKTRVTSPLGAILHRGIIRPLESLHPKSCGKADPCLSGGPDVSAPPGWRLGRCALKTHVLDHGSGLLPVAPLLDIGKVYGWDRTCKPFCPNL